MKNPDYLTARKAPSFTMLFPGDLRISDSGLPADLVSVYLEQTLAVVSAVAERGAKIVLGRGAARRISAGAQTAAGEERFARVLVGARDVAARNGVRIVLEPLHNGETNLLNSIGECTALLERYDIEDVPLVADLFRMMIEAEPLRAILTHSALIGHAHIADTDRRPPGQSDWPLGEFLSTLRSSGYDGTVSMEVDWTEAVSSEIAASLACLRDIEQ